VNYHGGKSRLARKFAPLLVEALLRSPTQRFVEPFVGGFNLVPAIWPLLPARGADFVAFCSDTHRGLIEFYRAVSGGWRPNGDLTREGRESLRLLDDWSNPETTFAAFACSFGGKEFGWWAQNRKGTNYARQGAKSVERKAPWIAEAWFAAQDFSEALVRPGDVIYADPPYANTTGYSRKNGGGKFDHERFYAVAEEWAGRGARVFVSEFTIPDRPGWVERWKTERAMQSCLVRDGARPRRVDYLVEIVGELL
jgi:DNA adenine methylase